MDIIRSFENHLIKEIKKLHQRKHREKSGRFIIEGIRLVEEGLSAGALHVIFYSASLLERKKGSELLDKIKLYISEAKNEHVLFHEVSEAVLNLLSETDTPQGIVAVAKRRRYSIDEYVPEGEYQLIVIVDALQDPGNLGTLMRTSLACGAKAIICLPGTVDPFNGKAIRSSMGSIFNIPIVIAEKWEDVYKWCRTNNYCIAAGSTKATQLYTDIKYPHKVALVIGNEGQGFINILPEQIDIMIKIPLLNEVESLNASVAGAVMLYEILRQKTAKTCHDCFECDIIP